MSHTEDLIARREAVVTRGVGRLNSLVVERALGATLVDAEGRELLDLATGIGVMGAGHCHPEVLEAVTAQLGKLQHACIHVATYEPYVALCERLAALFPHGPHTKVLLVNSGAEAVENAVKIARQATGKPGVLCFTEAFHGRTLLGMSLTSKVAYKRGCGPFAPEIHRLPYPNYLRYGDGLDPSAFVERELRRFRDALLNVVPAEHLAAVVLEVIQGEGGFVPCPPGYLRGLRDLCEQAGVLLILDEVQSGFCRTGRWAAYQHHDVVPHLSTWAKAMGGGLPIAAVIGEAAIMDAARPGTLGGTYGGNPVACASALATLDVMQREDFNARARALGELIRARLEGLRERCALVGDVRGLGAMMALELLHDGDPDRPATEVAARAVRGCLDRGVLVITAGTHSNVIRLLPPLNLSEAALSRGLDALEEAVLEAAADTAAAPAGGAR